MEIKEKALMIIIVLSVLILIVVIGNSLGLFYASGEVIVSTDKQDYQAEDLLKVQIENNSNDNFCFSSCYPYYIERESEGAWESYYYRECSFDDLVDKCLDAKKEKAFEFTLPSLESGSYRLAIPVCINCNLESFEQEKWFYSNEFIIK